MELVPAGYKQTEVGVIPEDWEVNFLGRLAFVTKLAGFEYSLYFNSYKDEGSIIVVRGTNITHNKMDLSDIKTIPSTTSNKLLRSKLSKNDLVFAYVGTIGPIFLIEENDRYHLGPNTAKISVGNELDSKFLYHYFTSEFVATEILQSTSVGAQPSLSMTKIRAFKIIIPPLLEQRAIATALRDADALLSSLDRLIAKKEALKQGAMQVLLSGEKRLEGFSGDWEVRKLGEIAEVIGGGTPSTRNSDFWNGDIDWFTPTEVGEQKYLERSRRRITSLGLGASGARILPKGTILLTSRAGIGDVGILTSSAATNQGFQSLLPKEEYSSEYLYYWLEINKAALIEKASGSTFLEISPSSVKDIQINIGSIKEQTAISTILSDMDAELAALRSCRAKVAAIKKGMMGELLTGRVRLV